MKTCEMFHIYYQNHYLMKTTKYLNYTNIVYENYC